jgi:ribonuclease P protein component
MLPKHQRLNLKIDFSRVIKGKRIESPNFVYYIKLTEDPLARVGISIRTKNFGKAHNRNRARRLTSQALQTIYSSLKPKQDLIIMPKSGVLESNIIDLSKEMAYVLVGR